MSDFLFDELNDVIEGVDGEVRTQITELDSGDYNVIVKKANSLERQNGDKQISLYVECTDDEFKGQTKWLNFTFVGDREWMVERDRRHLAQIRKACKLERLDTDTLHEVEFGIRLGYNKKGYLNLYGIYEHGIKAAKGKPAPNQPESASAPQGSSGGSSDDFSF